MGTKAVVLAIHALAFLGALTASGATVVPTTNYVANVDDLVTCVSTAKANMVVMLAKGVYDLTGRTDPVYSSCHLNFQNVKPIALIGDPSAKREEVVLKGAGNDSGKYILRVVQGFLRLENLTLENSGNSALYVTDRRGGMAVTNCLFRNNYTSGGKGAAVYCAEETQVNECGRRIHNCAFVGNRAVGEKSYGGAFFGNCVRFSDCAFSNNFATAGAGVAYGGDFDRCVFFGNGTGGGGTSGVIANSWKESTLVDCQFVSNCVPSTSGAAVFSWATYNLNVTNCTFVGNQASGGPCLLACATDFKLATFVDCTMTDNVSTNGSVLKGKARFTRCRFLRNRALAENVIAVNAIMFGTYENCLFAGNSCGGSHGNSAFATEAEFRNCTFANNRHGHQTRCIANYNCMCVNTAFYGNVPEVYASADDRVPVMTNCFWSAQDSTDPAAQARIDAVSVGGGLLAQSKFKFAGTGDDPWSIRSGSALRDSGWSDMDYLRAVGEEDLAKGVRVKFSAIDVGCYEVQRRPGLVLLLK